MARSEYARIQPARVFVPAPTDMTREEEIRLALQAIAESEDEIAQQVRRHHIAVRNLERLLGEK